MLLTVDYKRCGSTSGLRAFLLLCDLMTVVFTSYNSWWEYLYIAIISFYNNENMADIILFMYWCGVCTCVCAQKLYTPYWFRIIATAL